jgi:hypothetical protein
MAQSGPESDSVETTDGGTATDGREWQFELDEVGPDGAVEAEPEPLEPGTPTLENTLFVLLGVAGTLLLLATVL